MTWVFTDNKWNREPYFRSLFQSEYAWGLIMHDGLGPAVVDVNGGSQESVLRLFLPEAPPFGPDDGTISPWAVVASLPFAPEDRAQDGPSAFAIDIDVSNRRRTQPLRVSACQL